MEVNRRGNSAGIVGVTPVVPSPPTFSPNVFTFNNENTSSLTLSSSDGVFETSDLETAEIYIEGIKINYSDPAIEINGEFVSFITANNGVVRLQSYTDESTETQKNITGEYHITNIVFNGVAYSPENSRF